MDLKNVTADFSMAIIFCQLVNSLDMMLLHFTSLRKFVLRSDIIMFVHNIISLHETTCTCVSGC